MKKKGIVSIVAACAVGIGVIVGCQRGDVQIDAVLKGQPAPFSGYTISQEIYSEKGEPVPMSGVHIWIKGLDPNDILSSIEE